MTILNLNRQLSVAPMLGCTDRFFRSFLRLITKHTLLYTEMITTHALLHGDQKRLLRFDPCEHPIALQLGGNNPKSLAVCAKLGEDWGYDEINLNLGCPSPRVSNGRFGACLMAEPQLVADCIQAMQNAVSIPVTIKHRIGIDGMEGYADLERFVAILITAGCTTFIVHARPAQLTGLSPKANRKIPPLNYNFVYQLKQNFPHIQIILNGGITTLEQVKTQLQYVDGVMLGRAAYNDPWILQLADSYIFDAEYVKISRQEVLTAYLSQIQPALAEGVPLLHITRHLCGLFKGELGARNWRRILTQQPQLIGTLLDLSTPFN